MFSVIQVLTDATQTPAGMEQDVWILKTATDASAHQGMKAQTVNIVSKL